MASNDKKITELAPAFNLIGAEFLVDQGGEAKKASSTLILSSLAIDAGSIFATTTAGLAAKANGDYFFVPSTDEAQSLILYQELSSVAVEITRFPSAAIVGYLIAKFPEENFADWAYTVRDEDGDVAFGVRPDGTVEAAALKAGALEAGTVNGAQVGDIDYPADDVAFAITDKDGRAALVVKGDGSVVFQGPPRRGGHYGAELIFFNNTGQSLGEGSDGTLTRDQEHDNIGFAARASAPAAYVTLTVPNTQYSTRGESPMYGALGHIKDLILDEEALAFGGQGFQLLACNNAYSGTAIAGLVKGTSPYTLGMSQVTAGYAIAQAEGRTFAAGAMFWSQGESDSGTAYATYRSALVQLAADFDADCRAITGQVDDAILIAYQTASMASKDVALAQLAAADLSALVHIACPMYQFNYYDTQHIDAPSTRALGGYYGLVYKRVAIDGEEWSPVRPVSHVKQGAVLNVRFETPVRPLVLDTSLVPGQTNSGFTLVDSSNVAITINSVSVVGPDTVKIVAASSIPAGAKFRYGFNSASGKGTFTGSCGNLRDSQGDDLSYFDFPMHNWCVIFEYLL